MSPIVQRQRPKGPGSPKKDDEQHWGMLVFQSLSAGATTLFVVIMAVIALVGVYTIIVWPLTFWDGAQTGLEKYASWGNLALWSIFAGGSMAGFWCFSGAAFKGKAKAKPSVVSAQSRKRI
jgi:hypothetical protein